MGGALAGIDDADVDQVVEDSDLTDEEDDSDDDGGDEDEEDEDNEDGEEEDDDDEHREEAFSAEEELDAAQLAMRGEEGAAAGAGIPSSRGVLREWCPALAALSIAWREAWPVLAAMASLERMGEDVQAQPSDPSAGDAGGKAAASDARDAGSMRPSEMAAAASGSDWGSAAVAAVDPACWPGREGKALFRALVGQMQAVTLPPRPAKGAASGTQVLAVSVAPMSRSEALEATATQAAVLSAVRRGLTGPAELVAEAAASAAAKATAKRQAASPRVAPAAADELSPDQLARHLRSAKAGLTRRAAALVRDWLARCLATEAPGGGGALAAQSAPAPLDRLSSAMSSSFQMRAVGTRTGSSAATRCVCIDVWEVADLVAQLHERAAVIEEARWCSAFVRADRRGRRCGTLSWEEFESEFWPRVSDVGANQAARGVSLSGRDVAYSIFTEAARLSPLQAAGEALASQSPVFGSTRAQAAIRLMMAASKASRKGGESSPQGGQEPAGAGGGTERGGGRQADGATASTEPAAGAGAGGAKARQAGSAAMRAFGVVPGKAASPTAKAGRAAAGSGRIVTVEELREQVTREAKARARGMLVPVKDGAGGVVLPQQASSTEAPAPAPSSAKGGPAEDDDAASVTSVASDEEASTEERVTLRQVLLAARSLNATAPVHPLAFQYTAALLALPKRVLTAEAALPAGSLSSLCALAGMGAGALLERPRARVDAPSLRSRKALNRWHSIAASSR
ncbi:hypothetical protein FNF31_05309 [Cafeteria roenbergensis]|uniref:Uncharacterized protein n=1 Tax=Cafeteria roenbergensis TaxID=33653 RepID=A0A5A8CZP4_CAFRO|nr:hypothetical protein FNF31_05309 [Cafeteria roenbergensis]